jgi:hypothetical protein
VLVYLDQSTLSALVTEERFAGVRSQSRARAHTKAEPAFVQIVPTGTLLMNPCSRMRDPFESQTPMSRAA